jgi:hypothetical protein
MATEFFIVVLLLIRRGILERSIASQYLHKNDILSYEALQSHSLVCNTSIDAPLCPISNTVLTISTAAKVPLYVAD